MARVHAVAEELPASLAELDDAMRSCRRCPLYARATQAVGGEGSRRPRIMLVGEQPGDREDVEGRPFVGPAGGLLDRALDEAGITRGDTYITNAVKHFKWVEGPRRRRIHKRPGMLEINACGIWFAAELELLRPHVIVAMGVTAAVAVLHTRETLEHLRGRVLDDGSGHRVVVTVHPSAVLRAPDSESRHLQYARLLEDLRLASAA